VTNVKDDRPPETDVNKPAANLVFEDFIFSKLNNVAPVFPDGELIRTTLDHLAEAKEDRALVIVGALLLEAGIDDLLHTLIPGYKALRNNRDFSFSAKIELARSLKLCPDTVFNGADTIRQIRNAFAHDLSVKSLSKLPKQEGKPKDLIASMRHHYMQYSDLGFEAGYEATAFSILIRCMVETIYWYRVQTWLLNEFIRSEELLPALNAFCDKRGIDLNKIGKH
jgi:hypothetical protein